MHTVIVSGFWMDVHTVTNAAFAAFRASRPIVACREVSLVFSSG
jgi:formylglycine-generating enzyme required for sulfatase activity